MRLICDGAPELLFCDNESNSDRLWGHHTPGFFKDGINNYVVQGNRDAINPAAVGTKAGVRMVRSVSGMTPPTRRSMFTVAHTSSTTFMSSTAAFSCRARR
jgi:hypothetical protein